MVSNGEVIYKKKLCIGDMNIFEVWAIAIRSNLEGRSCVRNTEILYPEHYYSKKHYLVTATRHICWWYMQILIQYHPSKSNHNPKTPDHNYASPSSGLYVQIISTKAALPQRAAGHYPKHYPVL